MTGKNLEKVSSPWGTINHTSVVLGEGCCREENPLIESPELSSVNFFDYPLTITGSYFLFHSHFVTRKHSGQPRGWPAGGGLLFPISLSLYPRLAPKLSRTHTCLFNTVSMALVFMS